MTTPRLSFIQALRAGRHIVPNYIQGALVKLQTQKDRDVMFDNGQWYRRLIDGEWDGKNYDAFDIYEGEWKPLPANFQPEVGAACALGAAAVAMGCDLSRMADSEHATYYAHPDFFEDPEDRRDYPDGFIFQTSNTADVALRRAKYPCICDAATDPISGTSLIWDSDANSIPEIIAHLNDRHDPRRFKETPTFYDRSRREIERKDLWTEDRIVEWLRSMGFNGDHKA